MYRYTVAPGVILERPLEAPLMQDEVDHAAGMLAKGKTPDQVAKRHKASLVLLSQDAPDDGEPVVLDRASYEALIARAGGVQ